MSVKNIGKVQGEMNIPCGRHAIVRGVPDTYNRCIKPDAGVDADIGLAREQHRAYCRALESAGLEITHLDADDRFPDCCFVEDTAVIVGEKAIVLPIGAPSRVGEEVEVRKRLAEYKTIVEIEQPARIDGGDVLRIGKKLFVGVSERTNMEAVSRLGALVSDEGYETVSVPIRSVLHLKSSCSYIGNDHLLVFPGCFNDEVLSGYKKIIVRENESYSANCLSINGKVLMPGRFPHTKKQIETAGFETIVLDMSEFQKCGGSVTCLSIIF